MFNRVWNRGLPYQTSMTYLMLLLCAVCVLFLARFSVALAREIRIASSRKATGDALGSTKAKALESGERFDMHSQITNTHESTWGAALILLEVERIRYLTGT